MSYFKKIISEQTVKTRSFKWTATMLAIILFLIKYLEHIAHNQSMKKLIECVPNFSEGRDKNVIQTIVQSSFDSQFEVLV